MPVKVSAIPVQMNRELERIMREAISSLPKVKCSFCLQSQDAVRSIIASPNDPRAYICDECVEVCSVCMNPLLSEFLAVTKSWISQEPDSQEEKYQLTRMRDIARQMFAEKSGT